MELYASNFIYYIT